MQKYLLIYLFYLFFLLLSLVVTQFSLLLLLLGKLLKEKFIQKETLKII